MPYGFTKAAASIKAASRIIFCQVHATVHLPRKPIRPPITISAKYGSKNTKSIGHMAACKLISKTDNSGNNAKSHLLCLWE